MQGTIKTQRHKEIRPSVFQVVVVFTDFDRTKKALAAAAHLSSDLTAEIELLIPKTVPLPFSLLDPPVGLDFMVRQIESLGSSITANLHVQICLCRDREAVLARALAPNSTVVIGGRKRRLFTTEEQRLAHKLESDGHTVIFIE